MIIGCAFGINAQQRIGARNSGATKEGETAKKQPTIKPNVKIWKLVDDFTFADTAVVDTLTIGHQVNNEIWRRSIGNVTLGNNGSPSTSSIFEDRVRFRRYGNLFANAIAAYIDNAEDIPYFNTKTPYTNLAYQMGYPKRRSDEFVQALFSQNVNRRLNFGFHFKLRSSIGRYEAQRADHTSFKLFGSFDGDNYGYNFVGQYSKSEIYENGGIINDDYVLNPDNYTNEGPESIPVNMMNCRNNTSSYMLHFTHHYNLGHINRLDPDSNNIELPVSTAFHNFEIEYSHHEHKITDLDALLSGTEPFIYQRSIDRTQTADSTKYLNVANTFQLKFNEEANSIMHFGVRAFIKNNISHYKWPAHIDSTLVLDEYKYVYSLNSETRVTSHLGGEIFKNLGRNLRWKAEARLYFQGYRTGDIELRGNVDTEFKVFGRTAGIYANGNFLLTSPELYENKYQSNHFSWNRDFDRVKSLSLKGGMKIVENNFEVSAYLNTLNSYIYFASDGRPMQNDGVIQIVALNLFKHFQGAGFHSYNKITWQQSSNETAIALPQLTVYSSDFYEHLFFKVLTIQIGADVRYETAYYAPQYIPAIMQFASQSERKVGDHPYIDPFINIQLKRARIYLKMEHVNTGWPSKDSFYTVGYPANPRTFKFGVSWNFYD